MIQSQELLLLGQSLGSGCSPQEASSHLPLNRGTGWAFLSELIDVTSSTKQPRYSSRGGEGSLVFLDYQISASWWFGLSLYDWSYLVSQKFPR